VHSLSTVVNSKYCCDRLAVTFFGILFQPMARHTLRSSWSDHDEFSSSSNVFCVVRSCALLSYVFHIACCTVSLVLVFPCKAYGDIMYRIYCTSLFRYSYIPICFYCCLTLSCAIVVYAYFIIVVIYMRIYYNYE